MAQKLDSQGPTDYGNTCSTVSVSSASFTQRGRVGGAGYDSLCVHDCEAHTVQTA